MATANAPPPPAANAPNPEVPEDANAGCVGTSSEEAGKASGCEGCPNQSNCASGEAKRAAEEVRLEVDDALSGVRQKLLVLSGKGGVGKSTFSAQLAFDLASRGHSVGLLDIDICGPSIPLMLGLKGEEVHNSGSGWSPVYVTLPGPGGSVSMEDENCIAVVSVGFMLPNEDSALIWRGPRKTALIKQFLTDVDWGDIDYLVIDTPPGTSDEHISIVQYLSSTLKEGDGAVVITTPQEAAMADVRKELNFCKKTKLNVIGLVENMSGLSLPLTSKLLRLTSRNDKNQVEDVTDTMLKKIKEQLPELLECNFATDIFQPFLGGPEAMAKKFDVPFLGKLPLDTDYLKAGEEGRPLHEDTVAKNALRSVVDEVLNRTQLAKTGDA